MSSTHCFVDESKANSYVLVGVSLTSQEMNIEQQDKQFLIETKRLLGFQELVYWHDSATAEPLLSIPDAIAWAWTKGGKWAAMCGNVTIKQLEL